MRIVILTQYFPPEMGAPQSRLHELTQTLSNTFGEDVLVLTAMPNYPTGRIFKSYRYRPLTTERMGPVKVVRFPLWPSNSKKTIPRILSMFSFSFSVLFASPYLLFWRPNFIFVESPPLVLGLSGYFMALLTRAKFILNISDIWPLSAAELGAISKENKIYKVLEKLERFLYRKADLIFGQSNQIVEYISALGFTNAHLFRNGVDIERFSNLQKIREDLPTLRIVYAGLLGVAQGLLKICYEINFSKLGAELHIYGQGGEYTEIQKFILKNPDRGISLNPSISRDSIPDKLSEFDCALVPLVRNIFGAVPSKIYEAMAASLPILFSGDGEGASIIRSHQIGWVSAPGDYEELRNHIVYAKANPIERKLLGNRARLSAEKHFNRELQINHFHDILVRERSL